MWAHRVTYIYYIKQQIKWAQHIVKSTMCDTRAPYIYYIKQPHIWALPYVFNNVI